MKKMTKTAALALALLTAPLGAASYAAGTQIGTVVHVGNGGAWTENEYSFFVPLTSNDNAESRTRLILLPLIADGTMKPSDKAQQQGLAKGEFEGGNIIAFGNVLQGKSHSVTVGNLTYGNNYAVTMGSRARSAQESVAIGAYTRNLGFEEYEKSRSSVAVGFGSSTGGSQAVAVGSGVFAADQATALGNDTFSLGAASISIGSDDIIAKYKDSLTDADIKTYYGEMFNDPQLVYAKTMDFLQNLAKRQETDPAAIVNLEGDDAHYFSLLLKQFGGESQLFDEAFTGSQNAINKVKAAHDEYITAKGDDNAGIVARSYTGPNSIYSPNLAKGTGSIALGARALSFKDGATAVGTLAFALGEGSTAVGLRSRAEGDNSIAIGERTVVFTPAVGSLAMGNQIQVLGKASTAVGNTAYAGASNSLAFGTNVFANTELKDSSFTDYIRDLNVDDLENNQAVLSSIEGAKKPLYAEGDTYYKYSVGGNTKELKKIKPTADKANSVALGNYSVANGHNSITAGFAAVALGNNSAAYGPFSYAEGKSSSAFGVGAKATLEYSTALGTGSKTDYTDMNTKPYVPNLNVKSPEDLKKLEDMVKGNAKGVISVGSKGGERRITNLAPGAASTDAVNVSQLEAMVAGIKSGKLFSSEGETPSADGSTAVWGAWTIAGAGLAQDGTSEGTAKVDTTVNTVKFTGKGVTVSKKSYSGKDLYEVKVDGAGKSAFEEWKEKNPTAGANGGAPTFDDFMAALKGAKGDKGDKGDAGESAFALWKKQAGNANKTEKDFLDSLKGDKGTTGAKGEAGRGIKSTGVDAAGNLVVTYTDDTTERFKVPGGGDGAGSSASYADEAGNALQPDGKGGYVPADAVKATDGKFYEPGTQLNADGSAPQGAKEAAVTPADKAHAAVKNPDGSMNNPARLGNVADGVDANDAVNKGQLDKELAALKGNSDAYDKDGNKLVLGDDGKWYKPAPDGSADKTQPATPEKTQLKKIAFASNEGELSVGLGETFKVIGGAGESTTQFTKGTKEFSDRNTALVMKDGAAHLLMAEHPEFKGVTVDDGKGKTEIGGGTMTMTGANGKEATYGAEGIVFKDKAGETTLGTDGNGRLTVKTADGRQMQLVSGDEAQSGFDALTRKLGTAMQNLSEETHQVGAMSAAMSALVPLDFDEEHPTTFTVGYGRYGYEQAFALGLLHYIDRDTMLNAGLAYAGDKNAMLRVGASFRVGDSRSYENRRVSATDYALLKKVEAQAKALSTYESKLADATAMLDAQNKALEEQKQLTQRLLDELNGLKKKVK